MASEGDNVPKQRVSAVASLPRTVWVLGIVSLLMDVSSEMIHALLPLYLVTTFGVSMTGIGWIEGLAEATAAVMKPVSGRIADWGRQRKLLALVGYGTATLAKPLFALAPSPAWVLAARIIDRLGKGVREAPRDALIADVVPPNSRGAAFGLRQALDTLGALAGPVLAVGLMAWSGNDFVMVFWVAVLPAAMALAFLAVFVHEPAAHETTVEIGHRPGNDGAMGAVASVVIVAGIFAAARFSEAFLVLRAQTAGLPVALAPMVYVVMNGVYSLIAYPAGAFTDRAGRAGALAVSLMLLILADVLLFVSTGLAWTFVAVALWGSHLGMSQGVLSAVMSDVAPAARRGTAFGLFYLCTGLGSLAASVAAGFVWDRAGAPATFVVGASLAICALLALGWTRRNFMPAPAPSEDPGTV